MGQYKLKNIKYIGNKQDKSNWSKGAFLGVSIKNSQFRNKNSLVQILNLFKKNVKDGVFNIVIGDYLDRHNEIIFNNYTEEEAIETSLKKGDELIKLIKNELKELDITNYSFIRTQEFYKRDNFLSLFNKYKNIYKLNIPFKKIINETVMHFFERMEFTDNSDSKFHRCVDYLLEELAIFEMIITDGYFINIYPGKQLKILKEIVKGNIEVSEELKKYILVELKFIKTE